MDTRLLIMDMVLITATITATSHTDIDRIVIMDTGGLTEVSVGVAIITGVEAVITAWVLAGADITDGVAVGMVGAVGMDTTDNL